MPSKIIDPHQEMMVRTLAVAFIESAYERLGHEPGAARLIISVGLSMASAMAASSGRISREEFIATASADFDESVAAFQRQQQAKKEALS